jgi:hypothetical protein
MREATQPTTPPQKRATPGMPKLQALKSIFFSITGKTFQCIGTEGTTDPDDCIDTLKNMGTGQLYRVKLSHAMSQNVRL